MSRSPFYDYDLQQAGLTAEQIAQPIAVPAGLLYEAFRLVECEYGHTEREVLNQLAILLQEAGLPTDGDFCTHYPDLEEEAL